MSNTKNILEYTQELKDYFAEKKAVAPVEANASAASKAYAAGDSLWLNNILYNVTATIAQGGALTPGTNLEVAPDIETQLSSLKEANTNLEESLLGKVLSTDPYVLRKGLGNLADMVLVGGSVAWNQLVQNGDFSATAYWGVTSGATFTISNHVATFKAAARYDNLANTIAQAEHSGHKLLYSFKAKTYTNNNTMFYLRKYTSVSPATFTDIGVNLITTKTDYSGIVSIASDIVRLMLLFQDNNSSGWGNIEISNVMFIDLTALFGTTIADYIYSLETATAGAGVAWFRKYFPNAYYAYNAGEIQNVRVESRKVVGKNLANVTNGAYDETTAALITNNKRCRVAIMYLPKGTYKISALTSTNKTLQWARQLWTNNSYGSNQRISDSGWTNETTLTLSENSYVSYLLRYSDDSVIDSAEITIQVEIGTTATAYEPYQSSTYAFDPTKQLRGVPKLVDNKLSYDGDIYTAEGSITRKYGIVDLGTLTWSYQSANSIMQSSFSAAKGNVTIPTGICSRYIYAPSNIVYGSGDKVFYISTDNWIRIKDTAYTDAATFKTAMSGVYLVYELATPTTETALAYQNPQRAFTDGTEEFVDYSVSQNTRDVAIPVGNTTTYSLNESAPSLEDYVDGSVENLKAQIKAVVADSSDFADFQTKMSAI